MAGRWPSSAPPDHRSWRRLAHPGRAFPLAARRPLPTRPVAGAVCACTLATLLSCGDSTGPTPAPQVIVTPSFLDLVLGVSQPLTVTVLDGAGQVVGNPVLAYTSSDAARVGVSASGVVSALTPGEAVVTVSSDAASAYVSVRALSPASLLLFPHSATASVGDTLLFTAQALDYAGLPVTGAPVTFESTNPTVLQVIGPLGRVHAAGAGPARIRARSGTTVDSASVMVYGTPAQVTITPDSLAVAVSLSAALTAQVRDGLGQVIPSAPVTFASGNTAIVTVTAGGTVTAHQIGVTGVIAQSGAARDTIPVVATAASLEVTPASVLLGSADTVQLVAVARDGLGTVIPGISFTYRSSDPAVARVDTSGVLTFAGLGTADIVTEGGYRSDTTVVLALVARIPLSNQPSGVAVSAGDAIYALQANASLAVRIDPGTWQAGATIPVGLQPTGATFNATGTRAYVTNQFSQDVSILDPGTDTELGRLSIPADPYVSLVAPGDSILYVTSNSGWVYGIRLATGAIRDSIPGLANGLAARDTLLYVSVLDGRVVEYNLRTLTGGRTFAAGGRPQGIAISSNGAELYLADESGGLQFWSLASGARLATLPLSSGGPFGIAQQPVTGLLFVTGTFGGTVYIVDPETRTLRRTLPVGGITRRIAFLANGDGVVTNEAGWVDVIR